MLIAPSLMHAVLELEIVDLRHIEWSVIVVVTEESCNDITLSFIALKIKVVHCLAVSHLFNFMICS